MKVRDNMSANGKLEKLAPPKPLAQWHGRLVAIIFLSITLVLLIIAATAAGSTDIPAGTLGQIFISKLPFADIPGAWPASLETIIFDIRLPRVLLACIVGAALSVAGATFQGLFRNPLADPYLIGVAQGASLGAVVGFLLPISSYIGIGIIPVFAFTGGVLAMTIVYLLA
jgi:iron complex transport system permease protein